MPDTPLNPDALDETALANLIAWKSLPFGAAQFVSLDANAAHKVIEMLRPHLAVSQPEVNSVEELDQLPAETVVIDALGFPYRRGHSFGTGHIGNWEGIEYGELLEADTIEYPARVLYRPEVKP